MGTPDPPHPQPNPDDPPGPPQYPPPGTGPAQPASEADEPEAQHVQDEG
jgi:hypothetical protein